MTRLDRARVDTSRTDTEPVDTARVDTARVNTARVNTARVDPELDALIAVALAEDLADGPDVTTEATIPASATGTADIVARAAGTIAGTRAAVRAVSMLAERRGEAVDVRIVRGDGTRVTQGDTVLTVRGSIRLLLTAERTMLNLLCQLSGVATRTAAWVDAVAGSSVGVRDTRKTVPGMRRLQKAAVVAGGGINHRMGLGDAALVKDNHVVAAGSVAAAFRAVRAAAPELPIEVEVDTLAQLREALEAGADLVLLDNMDVATLEAAVAIARTHRAAGGRVLLEASGGCTLATAAEVAATGVDLIAIGELTHSAPALDLGFDLRS